MKNDDINGIFNLENLWEKENLSYMFEPITQKEFIATMKKFQDYHLVAVDTEMLVGYINGTIRKDENKRVFRNEPFLMIENIFVKSEYRNKKVGSSLLKTILNIARKNGILKFQVSTDARNMKSVLRFYESHGFKPFYVQLFKEE